VDHNYIPTADTVEVGSPAVCGCIDSHVVDQLGDLDRYMH